MLPSQSVKRALTYLPRNAHPKEPNTDKTLQPLRFTPGPGPSRATTATQRMLKYERQTRIFHVSFALLFDNMRARELGFIFFSLFFNKLVS